jgi:hypothetical protein
MALSFAADVRPLFRDGEIGRMSTVRCPRARCRQMPPGRRIVFRFSKKMDGCGVPYVNGGCQS